MKREWGKKGIFVLVPLAVGALAGVLTRPGMESFSSLNKPPLSPPSWLFPVVWTMLYVLMGISSYLIYISENKEGNKKHKNEDSLREIKINQALSIYGYQLLVNFLWPVFFFSFQWYFFAFLWLALLWVLVAKMLLEFGTVSKLAAILNVPYLLWLSFAGYLNLGVWLLN